MFIYTYVYISHMPRMFSQITEPKNATPTLLNLNLDFAPGSLTMIAGSKHILI